MLFKQIKLQLLRLSDKYKKFRCKHCCIGCQYFKYCQAEMEMMKGGQNV